MKTTVFIPAIPRSYKNLDEIVTKYNTGSVKPDEIIINASMVDNDNYKPLIDLHNKRHDNLQIIIHRYKIEAGPNRQMAKDMATGDIILYQDDDDIPCGRRVEIVKRFFDMYEDIVCLCHGYSHNKKIEEHLMDYTRAKMVPSDALYRKYFPKGKLEDCWKYSKSYGSEYGFDAHSGAVCIKKEVLDKVKWKANDEITLCEHGVMGRGEDYDFCMEVLYEFNKSIVVNVPLYTYVK